MLRPQEAALESKCEKIARIITKNYGITVRIEGSRAYFDLETGEMVLPNLADKEMAHLGTVLDGFLDHECGHPMFTDKNVVKAIKEKVLFFVWNSVEDCWTERETGKLYPGCKQNLEKLNDMLAKYVRSKWGECDALTKLMFFMSECWRGRATPEQFYTDPDVGALFKGLGTELSYGYTVGSTIGAVNLAKQILEKIASMAPPPPQSSPESEEDEDPEEGEGEGDSGGAGDQGEEGEEDQGAQESSEGDSDQSEGQDKDPARGSPENEEEDSQGQSQEQESPQEPQNSEQKPDEAQKQAESLQAQIESGAVDKPIDAEDMFNEALDHLMDLPDWSSGSDPERYIVFSEEFDEETKFTSEQRLEWSELYKSLRDEVHQYIGNMASTLELVLTAETESRWVGGARRGRKFDKRAFPRWFCGSDDDRIFRQYEEGMQWDTAVSLLFDCSGSMGSNRRKKNKSALARYAAIAFHEALTRANIPHEVLGFNTGGGYSEELEERSRAAAERGEDLSRYSRIQELDNRFVFVPFGETDGRALCAIDGGSSNRDGEAVMWAAKRLAARPEKRKILIVVSDGMPAGARYHYTERKFLQETVQRVIDAGLELYAIGVMSKHVKEFYPQWVTINNAEDLPRVVIQQLGQSILNRKGTDHGHIAEVARPVRGAPE